MSAVQLAQRRKRALLARRNQQSSQQSIPPDTPFSPTPSATSKTPFANDQSDDSEDDESKHRDIKKRRKVSSITAPETKRAAKKEEEDESMGVKKQKESQIGRLLQKRKEQQLNDFVNDDKLFNTQLTQCADDLSNDSYRSTPVDGFGESLLRSMGWTGHKHNKKDGDDDGDILKARPDRLGLGAKLTTDGNIPIPGRKRKRIGKGVLMDDTGSGEVGAVSSSNSLVGPGPERGTAGDEPGIVASSDGSVRQTNK